MKTALGKATFEKRIYGDYNVFISAATVQGNVHQDRNTWWCDLWVENKAEVSAARRTRQKAVEVAARMLAEGLK